MKNGLCPTMLKWRFWSQVSLFFLFSVLLNIMSRYFFKENEIQKKFQIFSLKSWVTPFRKMDIFPSMLKWGFFSLESFFLFRTYLNIMVWYFSSKVRLRRNVQFLTKIMRYPLSENGHFHTILDWHFCSLESFFFSWRI